MGMLLSARSSSLSAALLLLLTSCSTSPSKMGPGIEPGDDSEGDSEPEPARTPKVDARPAAPSGTEPAMAGTGGSAGSVDARPAGSEADAMRAVDTAAVAASDAKYNGTVNPLLDKCGPGTPKQLPDGTLTSLKPSTSVLLIGAGSGGRDPLPADLDQLRFYNRVLTVDELARHAAKTYEPCLEATGCVLDYTLDEAVNGTYPDSSGKKPARIVGAPTSTDGALGAGVHFYGSGHLEIAHDE